MISGPQAFCIYLSFWLLLCNTRLKLLSVRSPVGASLVAQTGNLPAMQKTRVQSLGWEDSLEKGIATHSSILAWRIPWTEPGGLKSMGSQRVRHDWATNRRVSDSQWPHGPQPNRLLRPRDSPSKSTGVGCHCLIPAFSKSSLYVWKLSVHVLLKPSLKNFEHYFASMWNECNCVVVWMFFGVALLWDWNENWPFPVLWPLLSFPNLLAYLYTT